VLELLEEKKISSKMWESRRVADWKTPGDRKKTKKTYLNAEKGVNQKNCCK